MLYIKDTCIINPFVGHIMTFLQKGEENIIKVALCTEYKWYVKN